jgi:nucleoside-diphosphate-sugar epimerase
MKALVIGGAGASGVLLVEGLDRRGYDVTVLHRGTHEPAELSPYRHIHADPHFAETITRALGDETWDVVLVTYGRLRILAPLFAQRCERLIAIGGMPIYPGYLDPLAETPAGMPLLARESGPLATPGTMIEPSAAKFADKMLQAESAVMEQHARGAYAATIFRYPSIYGPRSMALNEWSLIKRALDGRPFALLPNSGLGIITRCAAINAAHCVLLALDSDAAKGEIFNCADEDQYTLGQWSELVLARLGSKMELVSLPPQLNWAAAHWLPLGGSASPHGVLSNSKAMSLLGYTDQIAAKDAIERTVDWRLQHPPAEAELMNWADKFDYRREDAVRAALEGAVQSLEPLRLVPEVIHSYPHPKQPDLAVDHRGR